MTPDQATDIIRYALLIALEISSPLLVIAMAIRQRQVNSRDTPQAWPQAVQAAGVGRISNRAGDIGTVTDGTDPGRHR